MGTKKCTKCKEYKEFNEFTKGTHTHGLRHWCRLCNNTDTNARAKKMKYSNENSIKRKRANWDRVYDIHGKSCYNCDYEPSFYGMLDLHHVDPTTKEMNLSAKLGNSWDYIEKEVHKCILLCPTCHREHHIKEHEDSKL